MAEIFTGGPINRAGKFLEEVPASFGAIAGAAYDRAFETNPFVMGLENYRRADDTGQLLSKAQVEQMQREHGVTFRVPSGGMNAGAAQMAIDAKYREKLSESVLARSQGGFLNGAVEFGAGMAASLFDPLNIVSSVIPFAAGTRWSATLAMQGTSMAQRAGARAAIGVTEGALGTAAVEPLTYAFARDLQKDYTMADSLANIVFGSIIGGGLHVGGGMLSDAFARTGTTTNVPPESGTIGARVAGMPPEQVHETVALAVAQALNGRKIDVENVMPEVWRSNRPPDVIRNNPRGGDPFASALPGYTPAALDMVTGATISSPQVKAYYDAWVQMRDDANLSWGKTDAGPREPTAIELALIKARTEKFLNDAPPTQEDLLRLQHRQGIRARKAEANAEITPSERVTQVEDMWAAHERKKTLDAATMDKDAAAAIENIARHIDVSNDLPSLDALSKLIVEKPATVRDALAAIHDYQYEPAVMRSNRPFTAPAEPSQRALDAAKESARPENQSMYDAASVAAVDERLAAKVESADGAVSELQKELQDAMASLKEAGLDPSTALTKEDEAIAMVRKENKALEVMMSCQLRKG